MSVRRTILVIALAVGGLFTLAAPAMASSLASQNPLGPDAFVVLTGKLDLAVNQTASNAIILNGDATIAGVVTDNVVAFNGDVVVTGRVDGNVVSLNGRVTVGPGASVGGDVVSRDVPVIASSATIIGQVRRASSLSFNAGQVATVGRFLVWIATTVSSFLLGLVLVLFVPRGADATASMAARRVGASIGFGFLMLIGLPIAAFVAIGIFIGIPIGLGVLLSLGLLYWLGYIVGAYALGRRLVAAPTHRMLAFLLGWGILRLLALIPVVGSLIWLAATVWGLGALAIAARTAGRPASDAAGVGVAVGGPPPVPPPPVILG
jgi:hypothetical protein